jgi:apolipoprotein D and lipocalin family protein
MAALVIGAVAPAAALARAPPPTRPVSREVYSGRWYEIARTPNTMQKDCQGPTTDFLARGTTGFTVVETCHRARADGVAKSVTAKARILTPADNARFRLSYLGGLIHQDYWILDHADDNGWLLMGTPGGNYVWLLSRRPALSTATLAGAVNRAVSLGYSSSKFIYPAQSGG